jgi:hypothetical protein
MTATMLTGTRPKSIGKRTAFGNCGRLDLRSKAQGYRSKSLASSNADPLVVKRLESAAYSAALTWTLSMALGNNQS